VGACFLPFVTQLSYHLVQCACHLLPLFLSTRSSPPIFCPVYSDLSYNEPCLSPRFLEPSKRSRQEGQRHSPNPSPRWVQISILSRLRTCQLTASLSFFVRMFEFGGCSLPLTEDLHVTFRRRREVMYHLPLYVHKRPLRRSYLPSCCSSLPPTFSRSSRKCFTHDSLFSPRHIFGTFGLDPVGTIRRVPPGYFLFFFSVRTVRGRL